METDLGEPLASREGESKGGRLGGGRTGRVCVCVCVSALYRTNAHWAGVCVCARALNQCSFFLQARLLGVPGQMAFLSGPIPASVGFQVRTILGDLGDRGGTVDPHAWRQCR